MLLKKNMCKRKLLSRLIVSSVLAAGSVDALAAPKWDCRISADATTWDCYQDGNLVVQPMPQAAPVTSAIDEASPQAPQSVAVPDQASDTTTTRASQSAAATAGAAVIKTDREQVEAAIEEEESSFSQSRTAETPATAAPEEPAPAEIPAAAADMQTYSTAGSIQSDAAETVTAVEAVVDSSDDTVIATDSATPSETAALTATAVTASAAAVTTAQAQSCRRPARVAPPVKPTTPGDTTIEADDARMHDSTGIADFQGNVVLVQDGQTVKADSMSYNSKTADVHAEGNFDYQRSDLALQGDSADLNMNTDKGKVNKAIYRLPASSARGDAAQINLLGDGVSTYEDVRYTTCAPGNEDWIFNASELELDENTGVGVAKHMTLEFMSVPIVYLPWATFPIDDRRKSGFLTPSIGSAEKLGADISVPYYFNLAPNYDATLVTRIMSDRGVQIGGEARYLDEYNRSTFLGEILPDDKDHPENDARGAASLVHTTRFNDRINGSLNLNYVSDETYLEEFGGSLAVTSATRLERKGIVNYRGDDFTVSGTVLDYQILSGAEQYKKLPQIHFNSDKVIGDTDFSGSLVADYTYFDHELDSKAKGGRFDIFPSLSYDWNRSWGFLKPKGTVRYTSYDLTDHSYQSQEVSSVDRTTATFSLDSGLIFERDTSWFGASSVQTLEPRIFYVYTPETEQDDIPLFDTGNYTFSSASLFRENRFTGSDRVADANQATVAVTSRYLDSDNGRQYLTATFGSIFYFEDRKVQLSGSRPDETEKNSSYVLSASSSPYTNWIADAALQMDNDFREAEKGSFRVKYADADRHLLSARYQYEGATNEYTKLSAYWPIGANTSLVGHSYYQINDKNEESRPIETVLGIEYGSSCCWRVRALARDFYLGKDAITNKDEYDMSFYVQLQLSGFTSLGDDIDAFLEETMEGFVRETY